MNHQNGFEMHEQHSGARERVLATAQHLFTERGYKAVTMQDIAGELGMRQASLYYHAPKGKEQLFVEVAGRTFEQHREGLQTAIDGAEPNLEAQLLAACRWLATQPPMSLLGMMHSDMPALSEDNQRLLEGAAYRCLFEPVASTFAAAMRRGEIRPRSQDLLAGSFLALMDGVAYSSEHQPGAPSREAMSSEIVEMLLDGLRPR